MSGDKKLSERLDRLGAAASSLCAVHCAVGALLPSALSLLGLGFLLGHEAEWVFTAVAVAFALGALVLGWRRHRSIPVAALLALGVVALLASRQLEAGGHHDHEHAEHSEHQGESLAGAAGLGVAVGVLGGLCLLGGHILNIRATRRCRSAA